MYYIPLKYHLIHVLEYIKNIKLTIVQIIKTKYLNIKIMALLEAIFEGRIGLWIVSFLFQKIVENKKLYVFPHHQDNKDNNIV